MIQAGDALNGAGTTTGVLTNFGRYELASTDSDIAPYYGDHTDPLPCRTAWSLVYLFFNGRKAFASRRPGPMALSSLVAAQAATFGWYYFGQD